VGDGTKISITVVLAAVGLLFTFVALFERAFERAETRANAAVIQLRADLHELELEMRARIELVDAQLRDLRRNR
jgi:vacuolar-type H+-ATPase subunit B/Vma2